MFALLILLVVVSGVVVANRFNKKEPAKKAIQKPLTAEEMKAARKKMGSYPRWYPIQKMGNV